MKNNFCQTVKTDEQQDIIIKDLASAEAYCNRGRFYCKNLYNHHENEFWNINEKEKFSKLALADYGKAIELDPNYVISYYCRGYLYLILSEYVYSLSDLNKVIELDPNCANAYYYRSICYSKLKKNDSSSCDPDEIMNDPCLCDLNKAIKLNPDHIESYFKRAEYYLEKKKYDFSLDDFNKVRELSQNDERRVYIGLAECHKGKAEYDSAIENYEKAASIKPSKNDHDDPENVFWYLGICYFERGKSYFNKKDYDLFFSDVRDAIENIQKSSAPNDFIEYIPGEASLLAVNIGEYEKAEEYTKHLTPPHADAYIKNIEKSKELDRKNKELEEKNKELTEKNEKLALEKEQKEKLYKKLHEKEREMISFFTHTMRNALSTAPQSLKQAISLLKKDDYETNKAHYEAINEITSLFSTLSLTDCLIDTFKQSISDPQNFKKSWKNDKEGEAKVKWIIAFSLRQALNRIMFMGNASDFKKLLRGETSLIKPTRKSFIEKVLPLDINNQGVSLIYDWLRSIPTIKIFIEDTHEQFGVNQVKFSLLFAIISELILNVLKYWAGEGYIQISWQVIEKEYYIFTIKNSCQANTNSNLASAHKGLGFIKRLVTLLDDKIYFVSVEQEQLFTAELKLHKSLFGENV